MRLNFKSADFASALLDPSRTMPEGLVGPDGLPSAARFNVYRNNVFASLTRVLRAAFPATARIVGDEFFAAMARAYIAGEPPRSPLLFDYGAGFPDFIDSFEPVSGLPYLGDVARVERAWIEAYHASEAIPISAASFAAISPDDLPELLVVLHPALRVVRSRFPVLTIWEVNTKSDMQQNVELAVEGEDVLIIRPGAKVDVWALAPGGATFLQAVGNGRSMLEATQEAMESDRRFDLSVNLTALMKAGAFADFPLVNGTISSEVSGAIS